MTGETAVPVHGAQEADGKWRSPAPQLADLSDAWSEEAGRDEPDWTRLRAFLDHLTLHPGLAVPAIRSQPSESGSSFLDSLLASVAEKVADDLPVACPEWTEQVPGLTETWQRLGTPRMLAAWAAETPPQLAARRILIPASSLWRHSTR